MTTTMKTSGLYALLTMLVFVLHGKSYGAEIISVEKTTVTAIRYEKVEFDIKLSSAYVNPYDQADVAVDLQFTDPDGILLTLPCYYVSGNSAQSLWRGRFAAKKIGTYQLKAILKNAGVTSATMDGASFVVVNSAEPGFIQVRDNWTLSFDNGKPFRGVGENFGWEPTSANGKHTYDYLLPHLKMNGVNFFRSWMCNWNFPLEWKTTNSPWYTSSGAYFNPSGISRMDEIVDMIDSLDMKMMLAFDYHGAFMTNTAWALNNYNKVNGGPVNTPAEFFTSAAAKAMYKNRLRYIVARWGYSTAIAVWEFFNEIDNAMYNGESIIIPHAAVTQWHTEMSAYLKSIDPFDHVVSTSISHRQINGLFSVPDIDINQQHVYKATGNIPQMLMNNSSGKPFVIGEFGYEWDWNINFQTIATELDFDFKRGLWYGLFSPTSILPMSWWWEFFNDRGTDVYFKGVREISDHMIAVGGGSFTRMPATSPGTGLEVFAMKCGEQYFLYAVNTTTSTVANKTLTFSLSADKTLNVKYFNPETLVYQDLGSITSSSKNIQISNVSFMGRESKIYILADAADHVGFKLPYNNDIHLVPGVIQVEDFDTGGEGISFHDLEPANTGNGYRITEGVDLVAHAANQYSLSDVVQGEWLEYTVNVQKRATYRLKVKASSVVAGKKLRLTLNDETIASDLLIPATGNLSTWTTLQVTTPLLSEGVQRLRIWCESSEFSIDALEFVIDNISPTLSMTSPLPNAIITLPTTVEFQAEASDEDGMLSKVEFYNGTTKLGEDVEAPFTFSWNAPAGQHNVSAKAIDNDGLEIEKRASIKVNPSNIQEPFSGTPISLPGRVEGEDLDKGASGIAYSDKTAGNIKGMYRTDTEADIETCSDTNGGFNLADIQGGEWVEYTVSVAEAGKYDFAFRVATQMGNQHFKLQVNNTLVGTVNVPNTGAWQTWQTVSLTNVALPAGEVVLRLAFETEYFNLNYFTAEKSLIAAAEQDLMAHTQIYPSPSSNNFRLVSTRPIDKVVVVNLQGMVVASFNNPDRELTFGTELTRGLYLVTVHFTNGNHGTLKIVKE